MNDRENVRSSQHHAEEEILEVLEELPEVLDQDEPRVWEVSTPSESVYLLLKSVLNVIGKNHPVSFSSFATFNLSDDKDEKSSVEIRIKCVTYRNRD